MATAHVPVGVEEMLFGSRAQMRRWTRVPHLVILMSVMQYRNGSAVQQATADAITDADADGLAADLTDALGLLTDGSFTSFSTVEKETLDPGSTVRLVQPGSIVVGRYAGLHQRQRTLGVGGRATQSDGRITGGFVLLDNDFDREGSRRELLRMHELGHALGYNHVTSRASIMNPRIGSELTDADREAARVAFATRSLTD